MAAKKTEAPTVTDPIRESYLEYRRLEVLWEETQRRDPHDGQIAFRKGPLTVERDEALRKLRTAADAVLDGD